MTVKAKTLKFERNDSMWSWYPPSADATPADYSRDILKNARRANAYPMQVMGFGAGTLALTYDYRTSGNAMEYKVTLGCHIGGGWGNSRRESVAEWLGGKRWKLTASDARGARAEALNKLRLPEHNGRYLIAGAPPCPEKGKSAWLARWTRKRSDAYGCIATAGEGIDPHGIVKGMRADLKDHLRMARMHAGEELQAEERITQALADLHAASTPDTLRVLGILERVMGLPASPENAHNVRQAIYDRCNPRYNYRRDAAALHPRAEAMLARALAEDSRPLAIGIRATNPDGTPFHGGPFNEPHRVGRAATDPAWTYPDPYCGRGLHYIPAVHAYSITTPRAASDMISDALRYGGGHGYALWIVRADVNTTDHTNALRVFAESVLIDGHKAKAHTLTPIAKIGASAKHTPLTLKALDAIATAAHELEQATRARDHAIADNRHQTRKAATLRNALRQWRTNAN